MILFEGQLMISSQVILYEMLVGQPPFLANTPAETQYKVGVIVLDFVGVIYYVMFIVHPVAGKFVFQPIRSA